MAGIEKNNKLNENDKSFWKGVFDGLKKLIGTNQEAIKQTELKDDFKKKETVLVKNETDQKLIELKKPLVAKADLQLMKNEVMASIGNGALNQKTSSLENYENENKSNWNSVYSNNNKSNQVFDPYPYVGDRLGASNRESKEWIALAAISIKNDLNQPDSNIFADKLRGIANRFYS